MSTRFIPAVLWSVVACAFCVQPAHADIYTWVDAKGVVNISNIAPPDGVKPTRVTPDPPARNAAAVDAAREAARQAELQALSDRAKDLEVQALAERVRQLERDLDASRYQAPSVVYQVMPAAPVVQYVADTAPATYSGCDPAWYGCGGWWGWGGYPSSVVVLGGQNFRRPHPFRDRDGGQRHAMLQPLRLPDVPPSVPNIAPRRH
jgi:hypothetical protein